MSGRDRPRNGDHHDDAVTTLLASMQMLLVSSPSLESYLGRVAWMAANVVHPAASCAITTHYDGWPITVASSDNEATMTDDVQYGAGEGPCLESMRDGTVVDVSDQQTDQRWTHYRRRALELGVRSSFSVPLTNLNGQPVGALNVYSYDRANAFGDNERHRALMHARQASAALRQAVQQADQQVLAARLEDALEMRSVIDQAIGIVMAQNRCTGAEAFQDLRTRSGNDLRQLSEVAADIITQATGQPPPVSPQPSKPRLTSHQQATPTRNNPQSGTP